MSAFHERIKLLKDESGKTQAQIADELEITPQMLSYIMKGREPSFELLVKISKYFNVTSDYLLGLDDYKNNREQNEASEMIKSLLVSLGSIPKEDRSKMLETVINILTRYIYTANKMRSCYVQNIYSLVGIMTTCVEVVFKLQKILDFDSSKSEFCCHTLASLYEMKTRCMFSVESFFNELLKPYDIYREGDPDFSHPIINNTLDMEGKRLAAMDLNDPGLSEKDKARILALRNLYSIYNSDKQTK